LQEHRKSSQAGYEAPQSHKSDHAMLDEDNDDSFGQHDAIVKNGI